MKSVTVNYQHIAWAQQTARLSTARALERLGFHQDDGGPLIREGLFKPLGHPNPNAPKYFSADYIERLAHDEKWLARASDVVAAHHRATNGTQSQISVKHEFDKTR